MNQLYQPGLVIMVTLTPGVIMRQPLLGRSRKALWALHSDCLWVGFLLSQESTRIIRNLASASRMSGNSHSE